MTSPIRGMYLRPGNLYKDFRIYRREMVKDGPHTTNQYADTSKLVKGILGTVYDTGEQERLQKRFGSEEHTLTHQIVVRGTCEAVKGDMMVLDEEQMFLVLATENPGGLDMTTILYCEQRSDFK